MYTNKIEHFTYAASHTSDLTTTGMFISTKGMIAVMYLLIDSMSLCNSFMPNLSYSEYQCSVTVSVGLSHCGPS